MANGFSLAKFEAVDGAYQALLYAGGVTGDDFMNCDDPRAWVRKSSILLDACIDAGMSHDEPDHCLWAAEFICNALCAA